MSVSIGCRHGVTGTKRELAGANAIHSLPRYPTLIDAVAQSMGAGFVGTLRSTMSLVAARRVEDWNGGPTRMVRAVKGFQSRSNLERFDR